MISLKPIQLCDYTDIYNLYNIVDTKVDLKTILKARNNTMYKVVFGNVHFYELWYYDPFHIQ